ncbi:MAG: MFS transporter, partial [Actinomycetia bacterium]|nr:MFS transporter [Actinomycetes bacterium]
GMAGQMLALWFLAAAVGDTIGGQLANLLSGLGLASYFGLLGSVAVLLGLLMLLISPKVRGMMVGIK